VCGLYRVFKKIRVEESTPLPFLHGKVKDGKAHLEDLVRDHESPGAGAALGGSHRSRRGGKKHRGDGDDREVPV